MEGKQEGRQDDRLGLLGLKNQAKFHVRLESSGKRRDRVRVADATISGIGM